MRNRITRPSLVTLATRFFAYAQLRKKQSVETGELASALGTPGQERDLLRRMAHSLRGKDFRASSGSEW